MPSQSSTPPAPLQLITLTAEDLKEPNLLNTILQNHNQMINYILGHSGERPVLKAGADFGGQSIANVGAPKGPNDVVNAAFAASNYGAPVVQKMFESLGKNTLQSYRQLNNTSQREKYSSFLNAVLNTAPTANTSSVTAAAPSGGTVAVTVTSGQHQRVDGSQIPFAVRTDTVPIPASFSISSLTRAGAVVTAVTTGANTVVAGNQITIIGPGDFSFEGTFVVQNVINPTTFTYFQPGPNAATSGGVVSFSSVYYYTITYGQNKLGMVAAPASDSWSARTAASNDGTTIVAVVVVNSLGLDLINSAAGATPPVRNANVPVIRRL